MSAPNQDQYVKLDNTVENLESDMVRFFNQTSEYENMGISHKRGALVYGPPGNGKTFTILRMADVLARRKEALIFYVPSSIEYHLEYLVNFKPIFRNRPTVLILEEITDHAQDRRESLLSLLDGEESWAHNYVVATTNYPEKLPANIVDRPGRFDRLLEVTMPNKQQRKTYLKFHLPESEVDQALVERTDGFSIAYLKEMVLRSRLMDMELMDVIDNFKKQKQQITQAFDCPDGQLGFAVNGDS